MKKIIAILLLSICIVYANSTTQSNNTIQAIGYGNSEDEALKGAYQNAVEQYVGVLVDSSTIIQNDQLIKNDILTFSNGYIESYKKLSSKEQMGLWEVKIDAVIKKQNVLEKMKALNIDPIDIKDSEQTYAKLVTQVQSKFDAEDMIVNLMQEMQRKGSSIRYANLRIDSINLDVDNATRKYVPVTIKYSMVLNWDEYNKATYRLEKLFKDIGGKLASTNEIDSDKFKNKFDGCDETGPARIAIVVKKNNKLFLDIWEFHRSYNVIYPFQNKDDSYYSDYYYKDDVKTKVFTKESRGGHTFSLIGSNNNVVKKINNYFSSGSYENPSLYYKRLGNCNNYLALGDIQGTRGWCDSIIRDEFYTWYVANQDPTVYKDQISFNMDINLLKDLKQVKISWDNVVQVK